ncbi:dephospho-CoA kinase [Flavobacterium sp.]|uniref:dephospho-CoA kinase n=1 Tax=Flavobacterium sp. TaxID=239 RepID=UPI0039E2EA7A
MTKIIGLTGGIGSGKSTIGNYFRKLGIPVYMADDEGRKLTDLPEIVAQIQNVFGNAVVENGKVNRKKLSEIVFSDAEKLKKLNAIIHPAVKKHFEDWVADHQNHPVIVKETAILFESGTDKDCDFVISVIAPVEERIKRVMLRDQVSRESVLERINNQMTDQQRMDKSDFVIQNTLVEDAEKQAKEILKNL